MSLEENTTPPSAEGSWRSSSDYQDLGDDNRVDDPNKARAMADAGDLNETIAANTALARKAGEIDYDEARKQINRHERQANRAENKAGREYDRTERKAEREAADIINHAQEVLDGKRFNLQWSGKVGADQSEIVSDRVLFALGISSGARKKEIEDAEHMARIDVNSFGYEPSNSIDAYHISNTGLTVNETITTNEDGTKTNEFHVYKTYVPESGPKNPETSPQPVSPPLEDL